MSKFLPDDRTEFASFLRARSEGHAKAFDIAVYGKPDALLAIANTIDAAKGLYAALTTLQVACAANPEMQGRQYVDLGIKVNDALKAAEFGTCLSVSTDRRSAALTGKES